MHRMPVVTAIRKSCPSLRALISNTLFGLFLFGAVLVGSANAQGIQQFEGHVVDSSGALIQGATVIIHNEETGVDIVVKTTDAGDFTAPYLKPGIYTITAKMTGFKKLSKTHIHLDVDQTSK